MPHGYRALARRPTLVWASAVVAARLPVAMAPLAFVFGSRHSSGGYTLGAVMAAAYTVAEAVGAPVLGARLSSRALRPELIVGLVVSGVAFAALVPMLSAPGAVPVGLVVLAGAAAAAAPGGLRTLGTRLVAEEEVTALMSLESVLNQAVWAVAPLLVSVTALQGAAWVPFAVASAAALLAAVLIGTVPETAARRPHTPLPGGLARPLLRAWPIYLTSASAMYLLATAELALPALLEQRGIPISWSGPLLAGFAVASIAGGISYGLRAWPGSVRAQSLILLALIIGLITVVAVSPDLTGIATALVLAGLFQAALLIARNLSLHDSLPEHAHPAGYSLLYSSSGIGYGASGAMTGVLLAVTTPSVTMLIGCATALGLAMSTMTTRAGRTLTASPTGSQAGGTVRRTV